MADWVWIVVAGVLVVVLTPFAKHFGNFLYLWTVQKPLETIAKAIVREINGQLGLPLIREDISEVKTQVVNLEQQIEPFLTRDHP
jgi:hypothetical protein